MKQFLNLCCCILLLMACSTANKKVDIRSVRVEVMNTDIAFSRLSKDSGFKKAFLKYSDENMIRLNPRKHATIGRTEMMNEFTKDTAAESFFLTWIPLHVEVASSGDMASAFGDWTINTKLPGGKDTVLNGNYITIWKKQPDGAWKFILDGGNPTPGPTDTKLLENLKIE